MFNMTFDQHLRVKGVVFFSQRERVNYCVSTLPKFSFCYFCHIPPFTSLCSACSITHIFVEHLLTDTLPKCFSCMLWDQNHVFNFYRAAWNKIRILNAGGTPLTRDLPCRVRWPNHVSECTFDRGRLSVSNVTCSAFFFFLNCYIPLQVKKTYPLLPISSLFLEFSDPSRGRRRWIFHTASWCAD